MNKQVLRSLFFVFLLIVMQSAWMRYIRIFPFDDGGYHIYEGRFYNYRIVFLDLSKVLGYQKMDIYKINSDILLFKLKDENHDGYFELADFSEVDVDSVSVLPHDDILTEMRTITPEKYNFEESKWLLPLRYMAETHRLSDRLSEKEIK